MESHKKGSRSYFIVELLKPCGFHRKNRGVPRI
jgi:hypothetical protein